MGTSDPPNGRDHQAASQGTDWNSKSFDFAADATKQLITVATGVITATVIFSKDLSPTAHWWALAAWIALTISVLCGLAVVFTLSGHLSNSAKKSVDPNLYAPGIRYFSLAQLIIFLIGLGIMLVFGFEAVAGSPTSESKSIAVTCVTPVQRSTHDSINPQSPNSQGHAKRSKNVPGLGNKCVTP